MSSLDSERLGAGHLAAPTLKFFTVLVMEHKHFSQGKFGCHFYQHLAVKLAGCHVDRSSLVARRRILRDHFFVLGGWRVWRVVSQLDGEVFP